MSKTEELIEAAEQTDDVMDGGFAEVSNEIPADYLVRCNSCGWRRPKSVAEACPSGHLSGFSYAGPLEEAEQTEEQRIASEEMDRDIGDLHARIDFEHEVGIVQTIAGPVDIRPEADGSFVVELPEGPVRFVPEAHDSDPGPSPEDLASDMDSIAVEKAMMHMFDVQDRLDSAIDDHAEKADVAKTAKKRVESLQEDLSVAVRALREARAGSESDPERYPLLDGRKAEINSTFAKPESIAPLPADTVEEFYRRKKRDARFADLGLKPKVVEILEGAGYRTVLDLDKLREADADLTTIRCDAGKITEKRAEEIRDAVGEAAAKWVEEWNAAHPEPAAEVVAETPAEPSPGTDPAPPAGDGDPPIGGPSIPIGPAVPATESEAADA